MNRPTPALRIPSPVAPLAAVAVASLLLLSGCTGLPEGSANTGDRVTIRYSAVDAGNGTSLREARTVTFILGSGESGLGLELEHAVRGRLPNETFTADVGTDRTREYSLAASADRELPPIQTQQEVSRSDFESALQVDAEEGYEFPAYGGLYVARVTHVTNTSVTLEILAEDGERDSIPSVGATMVSRVEGSEIHRTLEAVEGARFVVYPASIYYTPPLELPPGSYIVTGQTQDKLLFKRSTSIESDLIGKALRFTVTVVSITPAEPAESDDDGNYGTRNSPQVLGDPGTVVLDQPGGPLPEPDAADDGHGHGH
jgi:hypothetical protein